MTRHRFSLRAIAGTAWVLALVALFPGAAFGAAPYQNPFSGEAYQVGRTDMGVDVCLDRGEPIRAVGPGVVTGVIRNWYAGQPYIWYQLTSGPMAGHYVYVAEQIDHLARIGQKLHPGQVVARFARHGSCIETGWSSSDGWTLAQATTGYSEGQVTKAGVSFARFLISLGVGGTFELHPTVVHRHHRHGHHGRG